VKAVFGAEFLDGGDAVGDRDVAVHERLGENERIEVGLRRGSLSATGQANQQQRGKWIKQP